MDEDFAPLIAENHPVALRIVEPLDAALFHDRSPNWRSGGEGGTVSGGELPDSSRVKLRGTSPAYTGTHGIGAASGRPPVPHRDSSGSFPVGRFVAPSADVESLQEQHMEYRRINLEMVVFADDADALV